jgi:hypothetical protein
MRKQAHAAAPVIFAILALSLAGAAKAQAVAPATAIAPPTSVHATKPVFTLDTPIEVIAANPDGKAILDKDLPGLTTHPMYEAFKVKSLKELQPMSGGVIADENLAQVQNDFAALSPASTSR